MAGFTTHEDWLTLPDGFKLYTKTWTPSTEPAKAHLLVVHGFSDHCNCYTSLCESLATQGIKVYAFDQRGWGRSVQNPSQRGVTGPAAQVMSDLTAAVNWALSTTSSRSLFLLGHSMGGGEVATWAATEPLMQRVHGILLDAPLIALPANAAPSRVTVMLGSWASRVLPRFQLLQKLDPKLMSRDPAVCEAWAQDPLCHDMGSLEALAGMLKRTADLADGNVVLAEGRGEGGKTRVWLGHGTADGVVSYEASQKWLEELKVEDKTLQSYDGWYHKLHDEPGEDKVRFANDVAKWILERSGSSSVTSDETSGGKSKL